MSKFLLVLAILLATFAIPLHAMAQDDQIVIDGALGILGSSGDTPVDVKFARLGVEEDLWYTLKQRFNVGGWTDNRGEGYSSSAFGGYQLGFEVRNSVLEASIFSGPTLISTPDVALGGRFQFNETVFLGVVDVDGNTIGMAYNHFSSAGLETPNWGKDFVGIEIKFPF